MQSEERLEGQFNGFHLAIGKQGMGKTLFMVRMLFLYHDGRKIFSNCHINGLPFQKVTFDKEHNVYKDDDDVLDILEMLESDPNYFNNSVMLLDEIHVYFDSLDFMRKNNRKIQKFFSQLRKRNILLLGTSQQLLNVDVRLRRQLINLFDMKLVGLDVNGEKKFRVDTHEIDGYFSEFKSRYYLTMAQYYDKYDTYEVIY